MIHLGDIKNINGAEITPVDVVCGGSPCQDLSVAGGRVGLDGERSGLFIEQIRVIKEIRESERSNGRAGELIRPRFMVWENVPGALSSNGGEDFRTVLEETARIADEDAVIPRPKKWSSAGCIMADGWSIAWRIHDAQFWGVPQRRKRIALVADFGGATAPEILFERKCVLGYSQEIGKEGKGTSGHSETGTYKTSAVRVLNPIAGQVFDGNRRHDYQAFGGVSETVMSYYGTGGNNTPLVVGCSWDGGNVSPTITAHSNNQRMPDKDNFTAVLQALGYYKQSDQASSLKHRDYKDATDLVVTTNKGKTVENTVRRLTPLECERLQGFPDHWTDIGEYVDSNGRVRQTTDSARYKALGNSIALPYWKVLARKIASHYDRDITMGSLFDGIGGFPLAFEHCGAKALWASEVEDFCIAVTKKHFTEEDVNDREPNRGSHGGMAQAGN